ncbi:MAG: M48 family metalloprotease [Nevskiales bacterium]|nr:M48 family metalloprotease [Nevskiales bacterium]
MAASSAPDLPYMGEPADAVLSPQEEQRIGREIIAKLYTYEYVLEDPELTEYVSGLGWRLVAAADAQPSAFTLLVLEDPRINAFALPGGYIGINAGLLTAVQNESELAGVLAHELAHLTQRHIARTIEGTQTATLATMAAMLAAIVASSANPEVVLAALSLGQGSIYQREVNFIRAHELEADRIGIRTLSQAHFDPEAMAGFFVRLEQQSRLYGNDMPEFLRTHPVNTTRISEARTRAALLPQTRVTDSLEFGLMQARARVLSAERPSEAAEFFLGMIGNGRGTVAERYGLALAYVLLGQHEKALGMLETALQAHPRQPHLTLLSARIQLHQGHTEAALRRLTETLQHHPRFAPVILEYASALLTAGQPEAARQLLLSHEQDLGTHMETYRLLALAAHDAGHPIEAQYQMASFLLARGDIPGALSQLDAALNAPSVPEPERAKLEARRAEVAATAPNPPPPPLKLP